MRRRRLRWAVVAALVALAVAAGAFALRPGSDRLTKENCYRIQVGMSREEVEAILGPPGDHRTGPVPFDAGLMPLVLTTGQPMRSGDFAVSWAGDSVYMTVQFDSAGCMRDGVFRRADEANRSPSGDLLWRLQRQWRRWFS